MRTIFTTNNFLLKLTIKTSLILGLFVFFFFQANAQKTYSLAENEFYLKTIKKVNLNTNTYELLSVEGALKDKPIQYSFDDFKSIAGTSSNGVIPILNENKKSLQIQAMNSVMAACTGTFTLSANTSQVCDGGNSSNPKTVNFSGAAIGASDGAHTAILKLGGTTIYLYLLLLLVGQEHMHLLELTLQWELKIINFL